MKYNFPTGFLSFDVFETHIFKKGAFCDLVGRTFVQESVSIYKGEGYYATIILIM